MKNTLKYTLVSISIFSAPLAAFTTEDSQGEEPEYDLPTYEFVDVISMPKPIRSPIPKVNQRLVGTVVMLKFTVKENGRPENVRLEKPLSSYSDVEKMTFANQTLEMVAKWRFKPALDMEDNPVAVNVIMPIRVVKYGKIYKATASLDLDESGKPL